MIAEQIFALFFFVNLFLGAGLSHAENGGLIFVVSVLLQIIIIVVIGAISNKRFKLNEERESSDKDLKSKFLKNFQGKGLCHFCNIQTSVSTIKFKHEETYLCCEQCHKLAIYHNMV